jgi:PAS domain S-box-containing protein
MTPSDIRPTGREVYFPTDDVIVSKTDPQGRITYVNRTFITISGYVESELLGEPHNIIRHPDMPRCVFRLLWETIQAKREIFAFVKNMTKSGDHYWVLAHVTPTLDASQSVLGFHSNRRVPERKQVAIFSDLYAKLLAEERRHTDWRVGMAEAAKILENTSASAGVSYEQFMFTV